MLIVSGDAQPAAVGTELPQPLVVRVIDAAGLPVKGQIVNFRVVAGGGSAFAGASLTNDAGEARERWTLGTVAGQAQRMEARAVDPATGAALVFAIFNATATAGSAAKLARASADVASSSVGSAIVPLPSVRVTDSYDNPVPGTTVTFAVTSGGGSITGTTQISGPDGLATIGSWTLGTTAGANAVTATAAGLAGSPTTFAVTGVAGAATQMAAVAGGSSTGTAGTQVTTPPSVVIRDAYGNPVAGVSVTFAVTTGGGSIAGATPQTNTSGVATVGSWTLGTMAGPNSLTATAAGLTGSPVTFTASGTPGPANNLLLTTSAAVARSGAAFATQPAATIRDVAGNTIVADNSTVVTMTVSSGAAVIGSASATAVNGVASFTSAGLSGVAGADYTLTFSSAGLIPASQTIRLTAGAASRLELTTPAAGAVSGVAFRTQPVVTIRDAAGNSLNNEDATVVTMSVSAGASPVRNVSVTSVSGVATFTTAGVGGAGGATYTLTFSSAGLTPATQTITLESVITFTALVAGGQHTCALTGTGAAYCWGDNQFGQLGDATTIRHLTPVAVQGASPFTELAAGDSHTCGRTSGGAVYCWGANASGQLGNGTTAGSATPILVAGGQTFAKVVAGGANTCALTPAGAAYCWGSNDKYQIGDSTLTSRTVPTAVRGGLTFAGITTSGDHSCGWTSAGAGYCWGNNLYGQVGNGTYGYSLLFPDQRPTTPRAVVGGLSFGTMAAGSMHTCGLTMSGATYCWGENGAFYQLGNGTLNDALTGPVAARGAPPLSALASRTYHSCGLSGEGVAYCWGNNYDGQLGFSYQRESYLGTQYPVAGNLIFTTVVTGNDHSCGITTAGASYCWGLNSSGQIGDGTTTGSRGPVAVTPP